MEDGDELVVSPKMTRETRDKVNILTREMHFKRASDTIDFLYELYEKLTAGMEFENKEEVFSFLGSLTRDKKDLAEENKNLTIWKCLVKEQLKKISES